MRTLAVVLVAFAALTACSSGDKPAPAPSSSAPKPSTSTSAKPATAAELDPCVLLPADAVSKALFLDNLKAVPGPSRDSSANGGKSRSCEYQLDGKAAGALAVTRYEGREGKPQEM